MGLLACHKYMRKYHHYYKQHGMQLSVRGINMVNYELNPKLASTKICPLQRSESEDYVIIRSLKKLYPMIM